jgi:hypothetical protein
VRKNGFWEDGTQCKSCKQCDIFLLCPQFYRSNSKFSAWMGIMDPDGGQIGGRLEDRWVTNQHRQLVLYSIDYQEIFLSLIRRLKFVPIAGSGGSCFSNCRKWEKRLLAIWCQRVASGVTMAPLPFSHLRQRMRIPNADGWTLTARSKCQHIGIYMALAHTTMDGHLHLWFMH